MGFSDRRVGTWAGSRDPVSSLAGGPGTPNLVVSCLGRTAHLTFPRPLIRGGPHDLKAPVLSRGSFLFGSGGASSFGSVLAQPEKKKNKPPTLGAGGTNGSGGEVSPRTWFRGFGGP